MRLNRRLPWKQLWRLRESNRATALTLALWVMVVLSALALQMSYSSHLRSSLTAGLGEDMKAYYLARAGMEEAIAILMGGRNITQSPADFRESELRSFRCVEVGEGFYTLSAGRDDEGEPVYGIIDESSLVNLNTAEANVLMRLPKMDGELVNALLALRQAQPLQDTADILMFKGMNAQVLLGEDENSNGLLDPSEDDGDTSWPPDNQDGRLDRGLNGYVSVWSGCRNVTKDGDKRLNLNSAGAEEITTSLSGITSEEAESIVQHRQNKQFANIAELLDVELLKKVETPQPDRDNPNANSKNGESENEDNNNSQPAVSYQPTGQKVFDIPKLKSIADKVTVSSDEILKGLININTASREVLAVLPGMDDTLARAIVLSREQRLDGFNSIADILDIDGITNDLFRQLCPLISVRSDVFRVRSIGSLSTGRAHRCLEVIIDCTEEEMVICSFRELSF